MKFTQDNYLLVTSERKRKKDRTRAWYLGTGILLLLLVALSSWNPGETILDHRHGGCKRRQDDNWINLQEEISYKRILSNIGQRAGAKDGLVVASQSKGGPSEPDYFDTWTRDSALTIKTLLPRFLPHTYLAPWSYEPNVTYDAQAFEGDLLLEDLFRSYITSQGDIQQLETLSGDLWTGGLNEPKFTAEGKLFNGDWGRPQRDGPPLRALSLIPYTHFLLDRDFAFDSKYVRENLYDPTAIRRPGSVIKNDLEEIAHGWSKEGFDLWEEVNGHHLWTRVMAMRALQAGSKLAQRLDDHGAATFYGRVAEDIKHSLLEFWVNGKHGSYWAGSISSRPRSNSEKTLEPLKGLDCGFLLSLIHSESSQDDRSHNTSSTPLRVDDPAMLGTLRLYIQSFKEEYAINTGAWTDGQLVGRYRGDVYDGVGKSHANPWLICSYSVAHVLYLAHNAFIRSGIIHLSSDSIPFWSELLHRPLDLEIEEVWMAGEKGFDVAIEALWRLAETYFRLTARHIVNGSMSEQIDRTDGTQCGARDLTWSHASFLDVARARLVAQDPRRNHHSKRHASIFDGFAFRFFRQ